MHSYTETAVQCKYHSVYSGAGPEHWEHYLDIHLVLNLGIFMLVCLILVFAKCGPLTKANSKIAVLTESAYNRVSH